MLTKIGLFLLGACLTTLGSAAVADELLKKLRSAASKYTNGGLLPLHAKYEKYAFAKTRKFGIVTLFTARNPRYRCSNCVAAQANLEAVQRSIRYGLGWDEASEFGNGTSTFLNKSSVFFALVDFDKAYGPFRAHGLYNVPFVAYLPPTVGDGSKSRGPFEPSYVLEPGSDQSVDRILKMIAQDQPEAGNVPQLVSLAAYKPIAIVVAIVVAILAAAMAADPSSWMLYRRPALWLALSLVVMAISISGVIYCIIRTPPAYALDEKGSPAFFAMQDGQGQTMLGGLAAGSLAMLAGLGAILAVEAAKRGGARSELGVFVWVVLGLGIFVACYCRLVSLYSQKVKWWSPSGLMSDELKRASRQAVGWLETHSLAGRYHGWDVWAASPTAVDPWRLAQAQLQRTETGAMIASSLANAAATVGGAVQSAWNGTATA